MGIGPVGTRWHGARLPGPSLPARSRDLSATLTRVEMPKIGDTVQTAVELPGIPTGSVGTVKAIDRLFTAVEFADGRIGYYSPRQLREVTGQRPDRNVKQ